MAKLMMMCPNQREPIHTGMNLDKDTFEKLANFRGRQVVCPLCGETHRFAKVDLFPAGQDWEAGVSIAAR